MLLAWASVASLLIFRQLGANGGRTLMSEFDDAFVCGPSKPLCAASVLSLSVSFHKFICKLDVCVVSVAFFVG